MKLCAAAILCFFLGTAFSENLREELPLAADFADSLDLADSLDITDSLGIADSLDIANLQNIADYDTSFADSAKIKPGLRFFVSAGMQFINFEERSTFQALLDVQHRKYESDYSTRQNFQTVNLTFPMFAGIIWQFNDVHSLGLGMGFLYDNESVVLTDKQDKIHNFKYTLQAFPVFAEYRLLISSNFISLKDNDYFSLFLRYYWLLPHTEIYSSWGNAQADFNPMGNGFGVFLGYRFWEWAGLSVFGEMGYLSLDAQSSDKNRILNSWNLGGISILIRAMY